jgi:hypothetical protein
MIRLMEEPRPDPVGDSYDPEPLWTAARVAAELSVPQKRVYELPIPRVRISRRCVRWRPEDVWTFIERRLETAP